MRWRLVGLAAGVAALAGCGSHGRASHGAAAARPPEPPARVFVAPGGNDAGPCTRALPCASFDRAYRVAHPGDRVQVAGGSYPSQVIRPDPAKHSAKNVVFGPAAGARVFIRRYLSPWGSHITVRDMTVQDDLFIVGERYTGVPQRGITAEGIDAAGLQIDNASDVSIRGGSFGGSPGRPVTWNSGIRRSTPTMPSRIVIDGARFHDVRCAPDQPDCHIECLIVGAVDGLVVRNSSFDTCAIFDMFFETFNGPITNVRLDHNRFGVPTGPDGKASWAYSVQLKDCGCTYKRFTVDGNVFGAALGMGGPAARVTQSVVSDNRGRLVPYAGEAGCGSPGIRYEHNVWVGMTCGSTDRRAGPAG